MADKLGAHHTTRGSMMEMGGSRNFTLLGGFHSRFQIFQIIG
jgi:hypothetical protein